MEFDNFSLQQKLLKKGILNISISKYVFLAYFVDAMIYPSEHGAETAHCLTARAVLFQLRVSQLATRHKTPVTTLTPTLPLTLTLISQT